MRQLSTLISMYEEEAQRQRVLSLQPRLGPLTPTALHLYILAEVEYGEIPEINPSHFSDDVWEAGESHLKEEQPEFFPFTFDWETDVFRLYYYLRTVLEN